MKTKALHLSKDFLIVAILETGFVLSSLFALPYILAS